MASVLDSDCLRLLPIDCKFLILDLVGAFVISTALVDVPSEGFHSNAPPFKTVAIKKERVS